MAFSTFPWLYNHHFHPSLQYFSSSPAEILGPLNNNSPSPLCQPLAATSLLSSLYDSRESSNGIIQCLCFCHWLISLSITFSRVIHVAACVRISFFLGWIVFHCMCVTYLVPSVTSRHLGCFHLWALVNNAMSVRTSVQALLSALWGVHRGAWLLEPVAILLSLEDPRSGLHGTCTISRPHPQHTHTSPLPGLLRSPPTLLSSPSQTNFFFTAFGRDGMRRYKEKRLSGQINLALRSFFFRKLKNHCAFFPIKVQDDAAAKMLLITSGCDLGSFTGPSHASALSSLRWAW